MSDGAAGLRGLSSAHPFAATSRSIEFPQTYISDQRLRSSSYIRQTRMRLNEFLVGREPVTREAGLKLSSPPHHPVHPHLTHITSHSTDRA